ncbi:hydroxymethylglutaryl-CoA reductase, degradative [Listeria costaricensis]|uniref:hydroxymethylglutaryl-CoA reductase, degradative n=1 Tax=Listeria costaricensis TaxID=2026604 RepID=UPI000C08354C|nr:hydroxymethylglutaryl-CoA reductase, degradative [Listeria costaricensis]
MFQGFYKKTRAERVAILAEVSGIDPAEIEALSQPALSEEVAEHMIENVIGTYELPFGVGLNMRMNDKDYLIPMVVEEPSVVAAQSGANKTIQASGGFRAEFPKRLMIGQIEVLDVPDFEAARAAILANREQLLALANAAHPSLEKRGGGARDVEVYKREGAFELLVCHLLVDTCDAMGANMINTMAEAVSAEVERLSGGRAEMRILSNLADQALATVSCEIDPALLASKDWRGEEVRDRLIRAYEFAAMDPYRAATHNKGIMNGIDAFLLACGNDWRSIEAAAHSFAARSGQYQPMSKWSCTEDGFLRGTMTLPAPVATVGGAIRVHPSSRLAQKLTGTESAKELGMLMVAVGLAQNFAALRALVTEGIQRGHMSLQARTLAMMAGAEGEEIQQLADKLIETGRLDLATAQKLVKK